MAAACTFLPVPRRPGRLPEWPPASARQAYGGEPAETVGAGELVLGLGDGDVEDALGPGDVLVLGLGLGDAVGLELRGADGSALGDGGAAEAVPSSGPVEEGAGGR